MGPDGREASYLIVESFKEDRQAGGQLSPQVLAEMAHDESHATDGLLLHFLVQLDGFQASQATLVHRQGMRRRLCGDRLLQRPDNLPQMGLEHLSVMRAEHGFEEVE